MAQKYLIIPLFIFFFSASYSQQKDTIYGRIKRIREKVIFLTEKENPQQIYYDDYGHSGFMGPKSTIYRFHDIWCSTEFCYYINYERYFDKKRRIIKDIWYGKKDSLEEAYIYKYDKKGRLIQKIDSSKYSVGFENHYYTNEKHENIIDQNFEYGFFIHRYKRYDDDGKLIRLKSYDDYGVTDEYIYRYNEKGKLLYRIYKNPNTWKKTGEKSWSFGAHDSMGTIYKDYVNEYDELNRLIKTQRFSLSKADENHKEPILYKQIIYKYDNDVLTTKIKSYSSEEATYKHFVYDSKGRLIENYCCSENKKNAKRIEKYIYQDDEIITLYYTKELPYTNEIKTFKIDFQYKYDDKGNWIEIIKTVDGIERYKWIRKLEYYK